MSVAASSSVLQLPSWVPELNVHVLGDESMLMRYMTPEFTADRDSDAVFEFLANDKVLSVLGTKFDGIHELSLDGYHHAGASVGRARDKILDACDLALSLKTYPTGENLRAAILKALCFMTASDEDLLVFESRFDIWYSYLKEGGETLEYERTEKPPFWMTESPLCVTTKGYIGIIPLATKPGDIIAVLAGARVPLVIRPTEHPSGGEEAYRLIGPCYIPGIMDGEAYPEDQAQLEPICLV
jgi:hypothetical protein